MLSGRKHNQTNKEEAPMEAIILTVVGLMAFEIISSIDNAVINAEIIGTMSAKGRKWFLTWGLLFGVFAVRGLLPWLIIWATTPGLGPIEAMTAAFSADPRVKAAVELAAPTLLAGGGTFLVFLFFHWLFLEDKHFGLPGERFFASKGIWFYAIVSIILTALTWIAANTHPMLAVGCVVGSTAFFITNGFKASAEEAEKRLTHDSSGMTDFSKIIFLEIIDMTFSIDGVLGAFAFTLSVPLIILGNGIGAIIVRQLTMGNLERIKKYRFLKNGAMYSILALGTVMLLDAFGMYVPQWVSPAVTFSVIGFFLWKSMR
jgi:hypothetical protein